MKKGTTQTKVLLVFLVMLLVLLLVRFVGAEVAATLPELNRPASILIDSERVFVNDGATIFIHRLGDLSLLKRFGKAGEGPGEFKVHPNLNRGGVVMALRNDTLLINSLGRISFFSLDGKYVREEKSSTMFGIGQFCPLGDGYVGLGVAGTAEQQCVALSFYDQNFVKGKEFYRLLIFEPGKKIDPINVGIIPRFTVNRGQIHIQDYEGAVHVFDREGNPLTLIRPSELDGDYRRVAVTAARRQAYIDFFLSDPRYKQQFERDGASVKFPPYFPESRDFRVDGDTLYLVTFRRQGEESEMILLDLDGRLLGKKWVALRDSNPREISPYTIHAGKVYQLVENPDSEEWELFVTEIR